MSQDPYAAWRHSNFRLFAFSSIFFIIGHQMLGVAINWEIYERTGSALALGWVGLIQSVPVLLFALPAGHLADRLDRRKMLMASQALWALCALGLVWISEHGASLNWVYGLLFLLGVARAFNMPISASLLPLIVPLDAFPNALSWRIALFQVSSVVGPAMGGMVLGRWRNPSVVYLLDASMTLIFVASLAALKVASPERKAGPSSLKTIGAGLRYVRSTPILLGAMTLDLFGVLFGGATTLLPVYAKEILKVGPVGFGWLYAAPSVGASVMALGLARWPPSRRAGAAILLSMAGFGLATIVFGLSTSFALSLGMLMLTGALDSVSILVRQSLLQLRTPDELRGRVSAVNSVFVSASNQLGGFESGLVAHYFGAVFSVVSGGVGTLAVVLLVMWGFPALVRLRSLREDDPPAPQAGQTQT